MDVGDGSLAGGAGWAGAGLLGLVLSWLLFRHLPEKDRQLEAFIKDKDAQSVLLSRASQEHIVAITQIFTGHTAQQRQDYREALAIQAAQCERELTTVATSFGRQLEHLSAGVAELNNVCRMLIKDRLRNEGSS